MIAIQTPKIDTGRFRFSQRVKRQRVKPFGQWLPIVTPSFVWGWSHLAYIRQSLDKVTSGEIDRLMIFVPPRHGKSEMTTIRYPVWRLEQDPKLRVIIGAYNQTLASKFSRKARKIARSRIALDNERTAVEDWQTVEGGGVRAVGVGGGITGQGGDVIIIDDPVKNREEANSQTYRDKVWDWYADDLFTRREPGAAIILIMTRWHEDDLAGRLLAQEPSKWTVVNLPALAESGDPLGRQVDEALCRDRYDEAALADIRETLGNSFYALYQQRPVAPEGEMFKRGWFEIVGAMPRLPDAQVRYWDKAGTAGGGAYTVGLKLARWNGQFYIVDVVRGQWAAAEREEVILQTAIADGPAVEIYVEQEPGSGGKESAESTVGRLAGHRAYTDHPTGDKVTRAEPVAAQAKAHNIKIVSGPWNTGFLSEITSFPHSTYKDQVDALSGAFAKLAAKRQATVGTYAS